MGWAAIDSPTVDEAKVLKSRVKEATYSLHSNIQKLQHTISNISHEEKKQGLQKELDRVKAYFDYEAISNALDSIEIHLNR